MTIAALDEDFHVHSAFSDDATSTVADNVRAAAARGLRTVCLADHVRRDTTWVPEMAAAVQACRGPTGVRDGVRVLAGVEAKILDRAGHLDLPGCLDGIDLVLIADHQFPGEDGPVHPDRVRAAIDARELTAADAVEQLCEATGHALGATDRGKLLAHLFSLLPKMGLDEVMVPAPLLARLAGQVAASGALVEINEKWSCPSARTVAALVRAGVRVVAGSDAHHCRDVGVYRSVTLTAGQLAGPLAPGSRVAGNGAAW
jgi:putative hydrolase